MMPKWAQDLTVEAVIWLQEHGYRAELPTINWRHGSGKWTSGTCYRDHIAITAGTDRRDSKQTLLHELAHWVCPGDHHGAHFYDTAWKLYQWAGLPLKVCLSRESHYKAESVAAYTRLTGRVAHAHLPKPRHSHSWKRQPDHIGDSHRYYKCKCGATYQIG